MNNIFIIVKGYMGKKEGYKECLVNIYDIRTVSPLGMEECQILLGSVVLTIKEVFDSFVHRLNNVINENVSSIYDLNSSAGSV